MAEKMTVVGQYVQRFNDLTGQNLPLGDIMQSSGLAVHVNKHHPGTASNINYIPQVISAPDYIGKNPSEPDSIELVKNFGSNIMVCVKLDGKNGYLYVASVFDVKAAKVNKRIANGRLQKY